MMNKVLSALVLSTLAFRSCQSIDRSVVEVSPNTTSSALTIGSEYVPQLKSSAFNGTAEAWIVSRKGDLLYTSDGGTNWDTTSQSAVARFAATSFIDSRRGWAVNAQGQVWSTVNGGREWSRIAFPEHGSGHVESPAQIRFVDELRGWMRDAFSLWRTEDGGVTWVRCLLMGEYESKTWQPTDASFLKESLAWVSSTGGLVHRTTDGGKTWHTHRVVASDLDLRLVQFINERVGWVNGSDGYIYRSDDGGIIWQRQGHVGDRIDIKSIRFVSPKEGWAVGWQAGADREAPQQGLAIRGVVLHTTDGGRSWQLTRVNATEPFFDHVYFTDAKHGWLFARSNVYHTEDGGGTWRAVLRLPPTVNG